ncbi:MAG: hypothetical protein WKF84_04345 [Pyrinomonadaceae bacterium]
MLPAQCGSAGWTSRVCDQPEQVLSLSPREIRVKSPAAGYVRGINAAEIGRTVASIGGGRIHTSDQIEHSVGFLTRAKVGDVLSAQSLLGLTLLPR